MIYWFLLSTIQWILLLIPALWTGLSRKDRLGSTRVDRERLRREQEAIELARQENAEEEARDRLRREHEADVDQMTVRLKTSKESDREVAPLVPWNEVRTRESSWLTRINKKEEEPPLPEVPKEKNTWTHPRFEEGYHMRAKLKDKKLTECQFTNERPPHLGYDKSYEGLMWSRFDSNGFKRMINRWARKPDLKDEKKSFGRIRTLLVWADLDMPKDLRHMAAQMLQGHRWMAHHYRQELTADSPLPEAYQVFRRNLPKGEGQEMLRKNFAKRTRERRWFSRMMDEREWQFWTGKVGENLSDKLTQWKEARLNRKEMLEFRVKKEPNMNKFTLFRQIKARRRWGNSLFVYFSENSVLISTDELL